MASGLPATRRETSLRGSSRLALSVGRTGTSPSGAAVERHPLKQEWTISYVHRPPGAKVDYEREIKRIAKFGSVESFLHLYSHLTPPNELPAVTDMLVFVGRVGRPGVWEEMRDGGKFTLRLSHPITPLLYETLLFSLLGDQFDDAESVVGCVLSVRQTEDIMSVWVEEEGEAVKSGALREKILSLLFLPPGTNCEYKSNRALLDAASKPHVAPPMDANQSHSQQQHREKERDQQRGRDGFKEREGETRGHRPWSQAPSPPETEQRDGQGRPGHAWQQSQSHNQWHPPRDRGGEGRDRDSSAKKENGW